ncbi:MAG TPA: winged helix-turn-helix domain-containing protein [Thermoanaerobaculia bacterium]|jgi:DNA-binding winged helix-turn-helix (wHTH) protein/tetratricopeptide (TPR) repeat protein
MRFGPFEVDAQSGELRREGVVVPLPPQPFRLLVALLARPNELVTREELRQKIWDDGTNVDFDRGLNFCVLQLRNALGDDAKNPTYIETLPKRGYRFIGSLVAEPVAEAVQEIAAEPRRRNITPYAIAASVIVAIVILVAWQQRASDQPVTSPRPATKAAAREAYLRGRTLAQEGSTPALFESVKALRTAIHEEPELVLAHVALAESLHQLAMRDRIPPVEVAKEIRRSVTTALRVAPDYAPSHATAAMLAFWYDWKWEAAEASYRRAIAIDASNAGALHDHGWLLITQGAWDEGIAEIRRAQELEPTSPRANAHVAWAYIYTRQFARAIVEANRALALEPDFREAYVCLEQAYLLSGDYRGALAARQKVIAGSSGSSVPRGGRGTAEELRGTRGTEEPREYWTRELRRQAIERETSADAERDPYTVAAMLAMAGENVRAIDWLAKAKAQRSTSFPLAGVDPKLESLHGDARYEALLREAGLTPRGR